MDWWCAGKHHSCESHGPAVRHNGVHSFMAAAPGLSDIHTTYLQGHNGLISSVIQSVFIDCAASTGSDNHSPVSSDVLEMSPDLGLIVSNLLPVFLIFYSSSITWLMQRTEVDVVLSGCGGNMWACEWKTMISFSDPPTIYINEKCFKKKLFPE